MLLQAKMTGNVGGKEIERLSNRVWMAFLELCYKSNVTCYKNRRDVGIYRSLLGFVNKPDTACLVLEFSYVSC